MDNRALIRAEKPLVMVFSVKKQTIYHLFLDDMTDRIGPSTTTSRNVRCERRPWVENAGYSCAAIMTAALRQLLFSMTASCKRHGIDPFRYLADVLRRLPNTPRDRLTELLPDVWFETHPHAARKRAA